MQQGLTGLLSLVLLMTSKWKEKYPAISKLLLASFLSLSSASFALSLSPRLSLISESGAVMRRSQSLFLSLTLTLSLSFPSALSISSSPLISLVGALLSVSLSSQTAQTEERCKCVERETLLQYMPGSRRSLKTPSPFCAAGPALTHDLSPARTKRADRVGLNAANARRWPGAQLRQAW